MAGFHGQAVKKINHDKILQQHKLQGKIIHADSQV